MIGTISIECNAKNPNMPLHPLRAYINSPSSLRITNVPRKIGKWNINKVTIVAIYPDGTSQTAECVLTGGVWVGTIEGSTTAGTLTQGYTILADGVDENGNDVTGYVLGKGDVVIMKGDGVPEPEPATLFVKLQDDGTGAEDGDIYPTENGYMIQQNGEAHQLGTPFDQITAYVDTQVSNKAEISSVEAVAEDVEDLSNSLSNYYTKSETSSAVEIQVALDGKQPTGDYALTSQIPTNVSQLNNDTGYLTEHQSLSDYYTKSETSSNVELDAKFETKAEISAIPTKTSDLTNDSGFITANDVHGDYIEDSDGNKILANREVHVINEISGLVFYDSIQLGYVDYLDENDIWQNTNHTVRISANAPESEYAWHILVSDFKYDEYITINAEGDFNVGESINWSSGNYYYVRNCVFTRVDGLVTKTTLEHLATQQWVEDKIWYDNISVVNSQNVVYLEDRAVQAVNLSSDRTVMVLPALVNDKTNDFVLDVCNTNQDSQEEGLSAVFSLSGTIGTDFSIVVPAEESFAEMTTLEAGEIAEYYFTKTAFALSSLPTWKVVKQKVEPYTPTTI